LGLLARDQHNLVMKALNGQKGVDLLSAPRVTTRSGQRAVIEIIREFRYPTEFDPDDKTPPNLTPTAFETRNLGITLRWNLPSVPTAGRSTCSSSRKSSS
jgi:general secretion pathway protein D